ncbi:MAG: 6-hydroxycyclohex-1-ene-1-carbonyl-CoA dehydrogenase [Planctomycetes bacterium]|nr:6-hydroxycyclohex-1-ene-1-carbonyl-CoA dehydrogenase [Planctomycetota bacterium]
MRIQGYAMVAVGKPLAKISWDAGELRADEALVEVAACGVCHTDLGYYYDGVPTRHPLPLVLGHEITGTVVETGADATHLSGRAVIVPAVMPCAHCESCAKGRGDICKQQIFPGCDVNGGFASHVVVPARGLCVIPGDRRHHNKQEIASLSVVADAVSTAYQAVLKNHVTPGDFVIVVGVGGVGAFVTQIARVFGGRVLALDVDDFRLALAAEHGAEWTMNIINLPTADIRKRVRDLAKNSHVPQTEWKIFETSGTAAGQTTAFALLTYGASIGVVGFHAGDVTIRLSNLMAFAARAEGTWGCPPEKFPAVLQLVHSGEIAIEPFVEFHPMNEIQSVFEQLHHRQLRKRPVLLAGANAF